MSLLHHEPLVADYADINLSYYAELKKYAAESPEEYPHKPPRSLIRLWCVEKKEYIESGTFNGVYEYAMYDVVRHGSALFFALMTLTAKPGTFHAYSGDSFKMQGRWYDKHVITAHVSGGRTYDKTLGGHVNDYMRCDQQNTNISVACRAYLDSYWYGTYALEPKVMRDMLYHLGPPRTKDFTWVRERHLWALRDRCKQLRAGSWERFRSWLLRQTLNDETRRLLGGRPGRLKGNQQRKRNTSNRSMRIIRTNRGA